MKTFTYFQPTKIQFGCGRVVEIAEVVRRYGKRCLIATRDEIYEILIKSYQR